MEHNIGDYILVGILLFIIGGMILTILMNTGESFITSLRSRMSEEEKERLRLAEENEELEVKIHNELLRRRWARLKAFPPRCPYRTQSQSDNTGDTCNAGTPPEGQKTPDPDP